MLPPRRSVILLAFALAVRMLQGHEAIAAWQRDGIPLTPPYVRSSPRLGSDGAGGVFVAWLPEGTQYYKQVWALRVLGDGSIAPSWPDTGVMIALASQSGVWWVQSIDDVVPDGFGGAFVQYQPYISHTLTSSLAHVTASEADLSGWPVVLGYAHPPRVAVDDSGGVVYGYHGFDYYGRPSGVYFNRLRPNGSVAATQQVLLTQSTVNPAIDTDRAGGAFACWFCEVRGYDSTLTEVWGSGEAWPGCGANMGLVSDGDHGAFLAWVSGSTVRVTRIDSQGSAIAGWTPNGIVAGNGDGFSGYYPMDLTRDGTGGLFVTWRMENDTRVQRVTGAGSVATGWAPAGTVIGPSPVSYPLSKVVPDGSGGLYVGWVANTNPVTDLDIYAQHLTASGSPAPGWLATGDPICTALGLQYDISAASDGAGGVYFGWLDQRGYPYRMYGQHILNDDVSVSKIIEGKQGYCEHSC